MYNTFENTVTYSQMSNPFWNYFICPTLDFSLIVIVAIIFAVCVAIL